MEKKIAFTNYKKLFTRLYNELKNAKNELETIVNECPAEETLSGYDHEFTNENGETKYIHFPDEFRETITPKLIEINCDREYVMWCIEFIMASERYNNLTGMIFDIAMSNDEAFEAKNEIMHKYKNDKQSLTLL